MKTVVFDNGVDIEGIKNVFNIWIDNFKKSVLDEEFKQDSGSTGSSKIIEDGDKLTFKFTTDFYVKISKLSKEEEDEIERPFDVDGDIELDDEEGEDKLKDSQTSSKGRKLNKSKYDALLLTYYQDRGWDDKGIPTKETMKRLNLKEESTELEKYVKLAD